jgi:hypothetical protein
MAVGPDCGIPFIFAWAVSKGKVAYCGFGGGVGATLREASVRKAGGERPNAEGENPGMERWVFSDVPVPDRSVPVGREKTEGSDGDCWC